MFIYFNSISLIPNGKCGLPYLGKATAAARAALPSPTRACWVFSPFCNPPNSDMAYRIFHVHTRSILCKRIHTGVGHIDSESSQQFCAPDGVRLGSRNPLDLESDALPYSHPI